MTERGGMARAIELALTRRVTSSAGDLEALRPWDASADTRPWVAIEFEQEEEDGRLATGTLEKWFGGQKGTVDLVYDGQRVTDPALADQVLAELSGIPTEAFFRSTASVRHHELSDLARDEAALRDRLQASIGGADRGTGRAKKKLERAIYELTTKGDKNPGRLKQAESAVASTAESVEKGELALAQLERDRDTLSGARDRRQDSERALAEKRAMLEKASLGAEAVCLVGNPGDQLSDYAKKKRLDLLVMGSHGYGAFKAAVLGSVATRVAAHCGTPLLLIREI